MTFSLLFNIANAYVIPFWIAMAALPNWGITKKVVNSYLLFVPLISLYIYYLIATVDPESAAVLANPQLADIAKLFSQEGTAGAGWIHFLAMDLFVGRWIYWQGQEKNILTTHSLLLCLFFGPVGLLSHIITDTFFGNNNDDSDNDNPETKQQSNVQ